MRLTGVAETAFGYGPHDHLCWSYSDPAELRAAVAEFLGDGLRRGQQVRYIGPGTVEELTGHLTELPEADDAMRRGGLRVVSLAETYGFDDVVDPQLQVEAYAEATEQALADGYTGLRVAADVTFLVRTPEQLDAFARYEHLADRYMVDHPFSALCAYNRAELGDAAIAEVACMHPTASADSTLFRLHPGEVHDLALGGELDLTTQSLFPLALSRVRPSEADGDMIVIDATELTFIDHRSLVALDDFARSRDVQVRLVGPPSGTPAQIVELLRLSSVHVEPAA